MWWRADRGSAAAELTLIAPLLILLLVFVAVVVHRGVTARLHLDDAAHQAARAASLTRSLPAAAEAASAVALDTLTATGPACVTVTAATDTSRMRPGGTVMVILTCALDLSDALPQGLVGPATLSATATEPIDTYRALDPSGATP